MKSRLIIIVMCVLLMLGAVYIFGTALWEEQKLPQSTSLSVSATGSIPVERGVFTRSTNAMIYDNMPASTKSLSVYYQNRAYPGAPPIIPHPLLSEKGIGGKTCLQCHQNGGYADQFKAFAPVTPHPELVNCKQCHVPRAIQSRFKRSNWEKIEAAAIHQVAMPGAPPVIPHTLEMRNNCLSCHAGPAAPKEIRVSHPERVNCRQCHVPQTTPTNFIKPDAPIGAIFKQPNSVIGGSKTPLKAVEVSQISTWVKAETQQ